MKLLKLLILIWCIETLAFCFPTFSQVNEKPIGIAAQDSLPVLKPETHTKDSVRDSVINTLVDKIKKKVAADTVDAVISYKASDSIIFLVAAKRVLLYGNAQVNYKNIKLTADYIEIDMNENTVYAKGKTDSLGKLTGKPEYLEDEDKIASEEMKYNFKTKKAYVLKAFTQQDQGYLHSEQTKKEADNVVNIKNGKYTTCDLEHPHFYIALSKAKVIPKDKIVAGPAYLVIGDVPMPIGIPFGFFPNKRKNTSGILIPEYGEETNRGFFLRDGGYYFSLSEYFDLTVRGDIYSKGTWGTKMHTNYKVRYKFSGSFDLKYYHNVFGDKGLPNYSTSRDFSVVWSHVQDQKANPTQTFGANVNFSSKSYDQNNTYAANNYLTNTKSSSIAYSKRWGDIFNFSSNLTHSQNSQNNSYQFTLPSVTFNMNRQFPFRSKGKTTDLKWYENIDVTYSSNFDNRIDTYDSLLFKKSMLDDFRYGFKHNIPVQANFKFLKFCNIVPKVEYSGWMYPSYTRKEWIDSTLTTPYDTINGYLETDTVHRFVYGQQFVPSLSLSVSPTIYGMFDFSRSRIKAIRHVITPSVSFSFKPGLGKENTAYYKTVQIDTTGKTATYSIFENTLYGGPVSRSKYGMINLSMGNAFEMKVNTPDDTLHSEKKVKLIESLNFNTGYDIFKDSMNWNAISMSGRTTLFKNLSLNINASFNPYALDTAGKITKYFNYDKTGKFARLTSAGLTARFTVKPPEKKQDATTEQKKQEVPGNKTDDYVDFNIPWNLSVDFSLDYTKPAFKSNYKKSLRVTGDVNITPKWKIGFSSGYDFDAKDLTYTTIDIYRDMHCWEMRFNWIPFGLHQSYSFQINVKASVLKDLKWNKRKSWYDNM